MVRMAMSPVAERRLQPSQKEGKAACAPNLSAKAIVFEGARQIGVRDLALKRPERGDIVVDMLWSGISTGTERMLWTGEMPPFPGMRYPLVPGYEGVGRVLSAPDAPALEGELVFVPGSNGFEEAAGLFGASASRLVLPAQRAVPLSADVGAEAVLLALAATGHHAIQVGGLPSLIIGHGVLGRLIARLTLALGAEAPTVWEIQPGRRSGAQGYSVIDPAVDERRDYARICDVSGASDIIDSAVAHSAKGAVINLAGFYKDRPSFAFPMAFIKEITLKIAAEWTPDDLAAVQALVADGALDLTGLITHTARPGEAEAAYATAFDDPACLKMIIDWRESA